MERMLILGAFNIEYIHDNSRAPFKEVLGSRCLSLNVFPLLFYIGAAELERQIIELVKEQSINHVHVYHDWIKGSFSEQFWHELATCCASVSAFYPDDEPGMWMDNNVLHYDAHYSCILTHSSGAQRLRLQQGNKNVYHLPWGFNKQIFHPVAVTPGADIVFIGKNKISDSSATGVEDGERRDSLLYACAQFAELRELRFAIYGYGWDCHPQLARYWRGVLPIEQFAEVYGAARIVINPAWAPGSDQPQVKLRHFEVFGSGALQLTNYNPELLDTIGEQDSIIYFNDVADALIQLEHVFGQSESFITPSNDELQKHSIQRRIDNIIDIVGFSHGFNPSTVIHLQAPTQVDAKILTSILREQFNLHPDAQFIHFTSIGSVAKFFCDDAWIEMYADRENITQFGMLFDFAHFQTNHLHFADKDGDLACEFIDTAKSFSKIEQLFVESPFVEGHSLIRFGQLTYSLDALVFPRALVDAGVEHFLSCLPTTRTDCYPFEFSFYKDQVSLTKPVRIWRRMFTDLDALNAMFDAKQVNVCVYGAGGNLGHSVVQYLLANFETFTIFVVDNRNAGSLLFGQAVYDKTILDNTRMDIILIVAELSGPVIYSSMYSAGIKNLVRCYDQKLMIIDINNFLSLSDVIPLK